MAAPRIYFIGASGVGKTTLARYVHDKHGFPFILSQTRLVLKDMGIKFADLRTDVELATKFQMRVWSAQHELEDEHWANESAAFVTDRGLDHLAYMADGSMGAWQIARSPKFADYINRLRSKNCVLFWVRPVQSIVESARDGTRDEYLEWGLVNRIDGILGAVLEMNEIPYMTLDGASLRNRCRTVDRVIELAKEK